MKSRHVRPSPICLTRGLERRQADRGCGYLGDCTVELFVGCPEIPNTSKCIWMITCRDVLHEKTDRIPVMDGRLSRNTPGFLCIRRNVQLVPVSKVPLTGVDGVDGVDVGKKVIKT